MTVLSNHRNIITFNLEQFCILMMSTWSHPLQSMVATSHQCCNKSPTLLDLVSVSAKSAHNNEQALSIVVHGNVQWKDLFPYVLNGRAPCSDLRPNFASAARGFAQGIFLSKGLLRRRHSVWFTALPQQTDQPLVPASPIYSSWSLCVGLLALEAIFLKPLQYCILLCLWHGMSCAYNWCKEANEW